MARDRAAPRYRRCRYRVAEQSREALSAWLWAAGTLGLEELDGENGCSRLVAYFDFDSTPPGAPPAELAVVVEADEEQQDEDWLETYRREAQPLAIGRRLLIDPREPEPRDGENAALEVPSGRIRLSIPARNAFGTGSHESTRLVLELLEEIELSGRRVLDVGAGSGILSFAALTFGASEAVGVEIDPPSVFQASLNARQNGLWPQFVVGGIETLAPEPSFSLALVNILPERMLPWLDRLPPLLENGSEALFSGILAELAEPVLERLAELGFTAEESRTAGEWIAFRCRYRRSKGEGR